MYQKPVRYYRDLKWWYFGWYSIREFKYVCWVMDDHGNAVEVDKMGIAWFHNLHWINPVTL